MIKKRKKKKLRKCYFLKHGIFREEINFKNLSLLARFINRSGSIVGSRYTRNVCAKCQRRLSKEIKRARILSLLSFISCYNQQVLVPVEQNQIVKSSN